MTIPTRRLIVLFDGTDNTPKDRTNVWRTHELLADKDAAGVPQLKIYIKGVGTELGERVRGSIFGGTISTRIRSGYQWLVDNYAEGAEIYVFGFSRGAFSARSLVQMLANCGLTRPEASSVWRTEQVFDRYEQISMQTVEQIAPIWRLRYWQRNPDQQPAGLNPTPDDQRLMDESQVREVKIRMAGLWDTVGAIGKNALQDRAVATQKASAHNVRPTKAQEYGYHALAIDEHRPMFDVTLWRAFVEDGAANDVRAKYADHYEQRWFIGAHSDVGGGYGEDSLPDLSLSWMMSKASALGLAFTYTIEPQRGAWHAPIHDSFEAFAGQVLAMWDKLIPGDQRNYRQIGKEARPVITAAGVTGTLWAINERIDDSVMQRWNEDPTYRPPGLVEYLRRRPELIPIGTSLAQRTHRIYANQYWNETGVYLRANTRYRIRVVPRIGEPLRDDTYLARSIDGEEWDSMAHRTASMVHGKRNNDAKWFALIGTIDKNHPFVIRDGGEFSTPQSGQLVCYFNDLRIELFYKNNSGWVVLEVEQIEAAAAD
jgi:uncharacterized protein (DUF2235 family)